MPRLDFWFTYDIAYGTMNRNILDKLWKLLETRRSPQTADDLEALAKMCGRRVRPGGNHPVWITDYFPHRPVPIEWNGGNRAVPMHARKVIINALEADASAWEERLVESERKKENGGADGSEKNS
jgi:hypothetical protein